MKKQTMFQFSSELQKLHGIKEPRAKTRVYKQIESIPIKTFCYIRKN